MDFQPILFKDYLISIRLSREYNIVKGYNDYGVGHRTADEREVASESKMLMEGDKVKYIGKGKEKIDEEFNDQGSNDIYETTLTPAKRGRAIESDE
ncbi:hypothetical protein OROMI_005885 [Orobanche minor]